MVASTVYNLRVARKYAAENDLSSEIKIAASRPLVAEQGVCEVETFGAYTVVSRASVVRNGRTTPAVPSPTEG